MSGSHPSGSLLIDVDCSLGIEIVQNSQVILIHREVVEFLKYLVFLMSFKRATFFFQKVIFRNTYPPFISVPPVDVFLLNLASVNKKM